MRRKIQKPGGRSQNQQAPRRGKRGDFIRRAEDEFNLASFQTTDLNCSMTWKNILCSFQTASGSQAEALNR